MERKTALDLLRETLQHAYRLDADVATYTLGRVERTLAQFPGDLPAVEAAYGTEWRDSVTTVISLASLRTT